MIPQQFIDEVQARTDIIEVISGYIPLKKTGRNFKAVCPFHAEKTPSFIVSPQKQIFHCFGCGEGGGAIHFLMLYEKITFVEAVEALAARLGMKIPFQQESPREKIKDFLYEAVKEAALFYARNLKTLPQAQAARDYLRRREISDDIIDQFKIGCSLSSLPLSEYMRKKDVRLAVLEKASLVTPRSSGGYRDLFWDRIMFPIFDVRSRIIGFGARLFRDQKNAPKYINSLENPLYSKREQLYGLNFARDEISRQGYAIVVEGYLDMIFPFSRGIKNIVASSGTALTSEQIRLIKRYAREVVLVYDADTAGQSANVRALDLLLEQGLRIGIVNLPAGHDPDSLVRQEGADAFRSLIKKRIDFFDYKTGVLSLSIDRTTIEGKTRIAQEMLSTIDKISSEVEKFEYIKRLSSYLGIREEVLLLELRDLRKNKKRVASRIAAIAGEPVPITEKRVLQFMLNSAKAMDLIAKNLAENDFSHPLARRTAVFLFSNFKSDREWSIPALLSRTNDQEISRFFSELLIEEEVPLNKDLLRAHIIKLRGKRIKEKKAQLIKELKDAETRKDTQKAGELAQRLNELLK